MRTSAWSLAVTDKFRIHQTPFPAQQSTSDRADKFNLGDEASWGRGPGELAFAAKERERVLAENAEEIRKLGKRAGADVIEIGRRLTEMKKMCGHGNWMPWLQQEFGWTDRHALNYTRVYELSLKTENFSDLGIPVSGLYLLAAPSTPPEAVDEVIECAKSGRRQAHAEIKGTIDKIKRVKATAAGIKPKRGFSKKRTKAEGSTTAEQEAMAEEWHKILWRSPSTCSRGTAGLIPMIMNGCCWSAGPSRCSKPWPGPPGYSPIAFYVLERDGRVSPNKNGGCWSDWP
jgi:hypothetical protein